MIIRVDPCLWILEFNTGVHVPQHGWMRIPRACTHGKDQLNLVLTRGSKRYEYAAIPLSTLKEDVCFLAAQPVNLLTGMLEHTCIRMYVDLHDKGPVRKGLNKQPSTGTVPNGLLFILICQG